MDSSNGRRELVAGANARGVGKGGKIGGAQGARNREPGGGSIAS